MTEINLGDRVHDKISGWEGIASARHEYLNGCIRWTIDGSDKDGKPEAFVFDEQQIEVLEPEVITSSFVGEDLPEPAHHAVGGPRGHATPDVRW